MHLVLVDRAGGTSYEVRANDALIGRDPESAVVISGDAAKTVSGKHARVFVADGQWWVEDAGSRNGTFLGDTRLDPGVRHAITKGTVIGLGTTGPRMEVTDAQSRLIAQTMLEPAPEASPSVGDSMGELSRTMPLKRPTGPAAVVGAPPHQDAAGAPAPSPSAPPPQAPTSAAGTVVVHVALHNNHSGQNYSADSTLVTLGRAVECSVRMEGESAVSVSRVHAEILYLDDKVVVRDNASRHGTFLNGKRLEAPHALAHGDFIMLGPGGPTFTVDEVNVTEAGVGDTAMVPTPRVPGSLAPPASVKLTPPKNRKSLPPNAGPVTRLARASGAVGRTLLFRNAIEEISQKSARRLRVTAYSTVVVLAVIVGALSLYQKRQLAGEHSRSQAQLDSIRTTAAAETDRLRRSFDSASKSAAPREVLDSLRNALAAADLRTASLQEALTRATKSLNEQLAAGDSVRKAAEAELARARTEMAKANAAGSSSGAVLDSLRHALKNAEDRTKEVDDQIRAVGGTNWARVAQVNEGSVGLVMTYAPGGPFDGSGFAFTPSGYFLTNRHVVTADSAGGAADSVFVIMADQKDTLRADVIVVAPANGPDVSVLRLRNFHGPYMTHIDWNSAHAVQGEGAALIGFPNGDFFAMDNAGVVHTSITAGIFSKVTPDFIQFAGFSIHGSSGSPLFNGAGEVVAIHALGLKEGPGLGTAVPLARAVALLPADVRKELGIR